MRNVSGKDCRESPNTQFIFSSVFLENCAIYEPKWKYGRVVEATCDNTMYCVRLTLYKARVQT